MSAIAQQNPHNLSGIQEMNLINDVPFDREEDPELPSLNILEAQHSALDNPEKSFFFGEEDQASFVVAAVGLAALDRPFRITPPDEEGVSRIDTDKSFITIQAAGIIGQYTIANNISIKWNTTTDAEAIPLIWKWAEEHAEALHSLGKVTIKGVQDFAEVANEEFKVVA